VDFRSIEKKSLVEVHTAQCRHDLNRMARLAEGRTQRYEFRMPDGKHAIAAACGLGSGHDGIDRHTRQSLVDDVLVGFASAKRAGVRYARIAIERLHERQAASGPPRVRHARHVEGSVEQHARPLVSDRYDTIGRPLEIRNIRR
jgi:hypothetical protein